MPIDAKQYFINKIKNECADKLTVTDADSILRIIADVLEGFEMRAVRNEDYNFSTDDLLSSFVSSMNIQGRSQKTIDRYVYVIKKFMTFVNIPTRHITVYHVRNWLAAEKARGIQDSTLEGLRQVLSSYFGWLHRESLIDKNPIANVGTIRVAKKEKKIYTEIDLEKLNQNCEKLRDKAIIRFLASTGCRISEMTSLNKDSVDIHSLECVVHGKGNKDRTVYMDAVTGMLLHEYLLSRKDNEDALFIGKGNVRLQPGGVRNMLKNLGLKSGVEHVHPHKFRRTLATELARHGMQIQEISGLLGHEKLDTTMKYVVLCKDDVKSNYRRYA